MSGIVPIRKPIVAVGRQCSMKTFLHLLLAVCLLAGLALAGPSPNREAMYQRIICVVPMIGSGTAKDPKRPLYAPVGPPVDAAPKPPGRGQWKKQPDTRIIAFQSVPTDDGKAAIVLFVARNYAAFEPILNDSRVIAKFERKNIREQDLVVALRKYRKNFNMRQLQMGTL